MGERNEEMKEWGLKILYEIMGNAERSLERLFIISYK